MTIKCQHALLFLMIVLIHCSCKKDYSIEGGAISSGSLEDVAGNCFPSSASGIFMTGRVLNDSNFLNIQVRVKQPGRYDIRTDTLNGYEFQNSGYFSDTGIVTLRLNSKGTPLIPGNNTFHIFYDSSSCPINVTVTTDPKNIPADFMLHGAPLTCSDDTIKGIYLSGVKLTDSNYVVVAVDVNSVGKYKLITALVNGYSFSDSGTFNTTGSHFVKLAGAGTPMHIGTDLFNISTGNSNCNFIITVASAVSVNNNDHFPLTSDSYWNYNITDTFTRKNKGNTIMGTSLYQDFEERHGYGSVSQFYFRKSDTSYLEYGSVTKYTRAVQFQPDINADILFLKEGLHSGESWFSSEFIGNINSSEKIYLRYYFLCEDNNLAMAVNGNYFINVYKVQMRPQLHALTSSLYNETGEKYYFYYAKGVGMIDMKTIIPYYFPEEVTIRSWLVK